MPADSLRHASPIAEDFHGGSPGAIAKRLFHATRPKFFPASVLPVLAGSAWGVAASGAPDLGVFALALLATVCVHAGSNVLNDVGDDSGGTDRVNDDRIYPYTGGSRFIQTGILSAVAMARLGISLLLIAAVAGFVLIAIKGPMILYFGMAGVSLGVLYSLGPVRLSSIGLGETAVAIAFGVVPVCGAAWLQGAALDMQLLIFSLPVSAWVAAILLINEVPDIKADGATGKGTLPVRLGLRGTANLYLTLHLSAIAACVYLGVAGAMPLVAPLLPAVLLFLTVRAAVAIHRGIADRSAMTKAIESTLAIHTLGSLWLVACMLYVYWTTVA
ncbi:MAG: prenyltransferase [Gammaproteobacteria bacterium]|nr:prenyltransferase [Gammaproteobacteria bacterium]